jgi:hypothetical protein
MPKRTRGGRHAAMTLLCDALIVLGVSAARPAPAVRLACAVAGRSAVTGQPTPHSRSPAAHSATGHAAAHSATGHAAAHSAAGHAAAHSAEWYNPERP